MRGVALACVLCGVVASGAERPLKLAAPAFEAVQVEAALASVYTDYFVQQLREASGIEITTQSEIAALIGFERQRQLLGCAASSCVAEMAGALGVDGVISGSLARLGSAYTAQVRILSARDGKVLFSAAGRVDSDDALHAWLREQARAAGSRLVPSASAGLRPWAWLPATAGGAALVASAVSFGLAYGKAEEIRTTRFASRDEMAPLVRDGQTYQTLAWVSGAVALAGAATAGGFLLMDGSTRVAVSPTPGGAALSVAGVLP